MQLALHAPDLMKWWSVSLMDNIRELTTDSKSLSYWATEILQNCGMTDNQQNTSSFRLITVANSFQKKKINRSRLSYVFKTQGSGPIYEKIISEKQYYTWSLIEKNHRLSRYELSICRNKQTTLLKLKEGPRVITNKTTTLRIHTY